MPTTTIPAYSEFADAWGLDKSIVFLNHGSYGACPHAVRQRQHELQDQLEREPLRCLMREWEPLLDQSRNALATFVGAAASDLVFVPNATTGVNTILSALNFGPQDEILLTSHEYNSCKNAVERVRERYGTKIVVVDLPFPLISYDQIEQPILQAISPRTRLFLIDHIVSQTAVQMPIKPLIDAMRARGIYTLIDGAHAPGMIALNLVELGADFYTGNCHKWLCTPKGSAFLYVRAALQAQIRPLVISHGANSERRDKSRFQLEFDWTGTHDPAPYLCIPRALEFLSACLPGGILELQARNHALVLEARKLLCELSGCAAGCPPAWLGSMATLLLPQQFAKYSALELHDALLDSFSIEVQVMPPLSPGPPLLRISAQLYNSLAQYQYLGECLGKLE
jgi:isopenicillin-N epimerase